VVDVEVVGDGPSRCSEESRQRVEVRAPAARLPQPLAYFTARRHFSTSSPFTVPLWLHIVLSLQQ
jgi:hypothetical protein